jgi:protein-disulfide isomerase
MQQLTKKSKPAKNLLTTRSRVSTNMILTLVVLVVAVAVIGGVLVVNRDNPSAVGPASGGGAVAADVLHRPDSHLLSEAADVKVTVVEFLDYQCPACAGYYRNITKKLEQDYAGRITFVARNFPLKNHPLAVPAAQAAEAAAIQGKYREMYHALYDTYASWALQPDGKQLSSDLAHAQVHFDTLARQIGLDLDRFHRDSNSAEIGQRIERDRADGTTAGVNGTPTIFVNGNKFAGTGNTWAEIDQQLRALIDQELAP